MMSPTNPKVDSVHGKRCTCHACTQAMILAAASAKLAAERVGYARNYN